MKKFYPLFFLFSLCVVSLFAQSNLTLRIIHNNDGESKLLPTEIDGRMIGGAAPFKTVVDELRAESTPSIMLSSGDNFLAGIVFDANGEDKPLFDAQVLDALNYDAICIGNHDFDFGPDVLAKMITDFTATMPPYLSANLDFSNEAGLQALVDAGRVQASTVIDVNGQQIGVVGLTTSNLPSITNTGEVVVNTDILGIAQAQINALKESGINKIILISHLQGIDEEVALAGQLTDVDVIIAGGGDELLTNDASITLPGVNVFGSYPFEVTDAAGSTTYIVTTPGEYRYVGNLVVDFDADGKVTAIGEESNPILVADVTPDSTLQTNVIDSVIAAISNVTVVARTEVDLDGTRGSIRSVETNEGNLIVDAFLFATAQAMDLNLDANTPVIALTNGGGIRNNDIIRAGSDITDSKTKEMLPFGNGVVVLNPATPAQLKTILENAVAAIGNGEGTGRFGQIGGFKFVYNPAEAFSTYSEDGTTLLSEGRRIVSATLDDGTKMIENGEPVAGAPNVYIVTNDFIAGGRDGYTTFGELGIVGTVSEDYKLPLDDYLINGLNGVVTAADYPAGGEGRITTGMLDLANTSLEDCEDELPVANDEFPLEVLSTYATGAFDEAAAEIVAYDKTSQRLFFTNADANTVAILDISNPTTPTLVGEVSMEQFGGSINSVAVANGIVAAAVEGAAVADNGTIVFMDTDGNTLNTVTAGVLPDMITFTPDGTKVLTANEGEPSDDYTIDPEGSVTIVDIVNGVDNPTVTQITFETYNDKKVSLQNRGVRIFGLNATVAQDLEPEYVAVSADGKLAHVGLQENNAFAVIDLENNALLDILPLGVKNHNNGQPKLTEFVLNELIDMPALGTPEYGGGQPTVFLGGFSGLYYDETESSLSKYVFYAVPDRGPNDATVKKAEVTPATSQNLRPFKLPNYQGRIAKFTVDILSGTVTLDEQIMLTRADGTTPISGRGNIPGFDEVPVVPAFDGGSAISIVLSEDFNDGTLGSFTALSVASDNNWEARDFDGGFFAQANGFGADAASEDYLISPVIDLSAANSATLSFRTARNFDGGNFQIWVSTDYDGMGNPNDFTWTDLTEQATLSGGNYEYVASGDIDLSDHLAATTYVAFRYTSTGTAAGDGALWQVDDIAVATVEEGAFASVDYVGPDGTEYSALEYDPYGGDFEGILKDNDGNFWMCDEYRPAIYKFAPNGTLIERYVPQGTSMLGDTPQAVGFYGAETLPAVYSKRRANRGFEAIAYDSEANVIYAFIQSPMYNPSSATKNNSDVIRILGVDASNGTPVSEYVYLLERNRDAGFSFGRVDKIGDAVYTGNGRFMVLERDSSVPGEDEGKKYVYEINLVGATNILGTELSIQAETSTLEEMTADMLAAAGIQAVTKTKVVNLPSIGYLPSDKPEGLALLPNGAIAVLNDNDFGLAGAGVSDNSTLGIVQFCDDNAIDASNRSEGINFANWNTFGYYMPDAMKAFSVGDRNYIITANEGDARDYDGYSEETRVKDLTLDETAYPNAATLQEDANLGRLKTTVANGDLDGDGDIDQIYSYGARSFSIFDQYGNLVFDSGNEFARYIANIDPANFNSTNDENDSGKNRSDDKGTEPEAVEVAELNGQLYGLIGLERHGGIVVYNITDPTAPYFVNYVNNRDFTVEDATSAEVGDLGIEDIVFISAEDSPNGSPIVVTANEVSGTVTLFGTTSVATEELELAAWDFQVSPNPFLETFNISYELPTTSEVTISLVNALGQTVKQITTEKQQAGTYQYEVATKELAAGVYYLNIQTVDAVKAIPVIKQR